MPKTNPSRTAKWVKLFAALALIPYCLGSLKALWSVLRLSGSADLFWAAFGAGFACWWIIYVYLPKPLWLYVFGHELTHALWTWIFGGRVKRFKVSSKGGHVAITKSNFLISLAPYFFPLYACLVALLFLIGDKIGGKLPSASLEHFFLGGAYGFHVTLTVHALQTEQTDITEHGWLFSAIMIVTINLLILIVGIALFSQKIGVLAALNLTVLRTGELIRFAGSRFAI